MVAHTIPTSAWSHNCGMHVIADYLMEQLQKEDYEIFFSGNVYDKFLTHLKSLYKETDLTWSQLREVNLHRSKIDGQIILGYACRHMLPSILRENSEYKKNMLEQFLALLNLIRADKWDEAKQTYPILLEANLEYLKSAVGQLKDLDEVSLMNNLQLVKDYFNQTAFDCYCEKIIFLNPETNGFLWLGIEELTAFCNFLQIQVEFDQRKLFAQYNPNILYFYHSDGHWERAVNTQEDNDYKIRYYNSNFYNIYLTDKEECFLRNIAKVVDIYLSKKYSELDVSSLSQEEAEKKISLYLEGSFKNTIPQNLSLHMALKLSLEHSIENQDYKNVYLGAQKLLLSKVKTDDVILGQDALKIIEEAFQYSFFEWISNISLFFEKLENKKSCDSFFLISEFFVKKLCKAIADTNSRDIASCIKSNYKILSFPGKNNPFHFAFKAQKLDFFKEKLFEVMMSFPFDMKQEETENCIKSLEDSVTDEADRTLRFRLERKKYISALKEQLSVADSLVARTNIKRKIAQFYLGKGRINLVDWQYEKTIHNAKIQATYIARLGSPAIRMIRFAGIIPNQGVLRYSLELCRHYIEEIFVKSAITVGGKTMSFLTPSIIKKPLVKLANYTNNYVSSVVGSDPNYTSEYLQAFGTHVFTFTLMPHYYVASTIINNGVYITFKDRGYDNTEALFQVFGDGLTFGINSSVQHGLSTDNASYQYQLNKNLTPFMGEYMAKYVAPIVTYCDRVNQNVSKVINRFYNDSYLSKSINDLNMSSWSAIQFLEYIQKQKNGFVDMALNTYEGGLLSWMSDSNFKSDRLHALQVYRVNQRQQRVFNLEKAIDQVESDIEDLKLNINNAKNELELVKADPKNSEADLKQKQENIDEMNVLLSDQLRVAEQSKATLVFEREVLDKYSKNADFLYEKTEGYAYAKNWQEAYLNYRYAKVKFDGDANEIAKLKLEQEKLLTQSKFYNTPLANEMLDAWEKSVDYLYTQHADNFPNGANHAKFIDGIIDKGFTDFQDRNELAKYLADKLISIKYPFYPDEGNKVEIEAERQKFLEDIADHELSGYARNTRRSKNRLYDYFFAKITNTDKKPHYHRWERICKPVLNEILSEMIGWKPFKNFNGGEERHGRAGFQFSFNSNGEANVHVTAGNDQPIFTVYSSKIEQPKQITHSSLALTDASSGALAADQLGYHSTSYSLAFTPVAEEEPKSYSSLSGNNPSIDRYLINESEEWFPEAKKVYDAYNQAEIETNNNQPNPMEDRSSTTQTNVATENPPAAASQHVAPIHISAQSEQTQPSILNNFQSSNNQKFSLELITPSLYAITHPESQPAIGTGISQQPFSCIVSPAVPPVKQPAVPSGSKVEPNKPKSGPTKAPNSSKNPKPAEGNAKQKVTISKKPSKNTLPAPAPKPVVFRDKTSTAAASDAQSGWSKTHQVIVTGQPQPGNQLTPQMPTDPKILQAWEKIRPELEKPGLTASRVGEIFFEAAEEFAIETMEGIKALAEFSAKEKHFGTIVGGVQTAQIGIMCGKFVGDEAMRIVAHEKLESMKVVEEWFDSLINLSGEELIKEGLKFGFGCTPVLAPLKGVKIAGELSKGALKAVGIAEKGKSVEEFGLLGITKLNKATETSQQSVLKTTPAYDLHRKLSSESLNSLAKPVDQALINQLNKKGWIIDIAKPGTDNWRWLEYNGADASFNTGVPKHILLKEGAPRSALLEEFLHGTQNDLNLIEKYGTFQNLEIHVKDFMLRHVNLLGLNNPHDIRLLQQLKIEEVDRLRNMKI